MVYIIIAAIIVAAIFLFLQHPKFGVMPRGESLQRIKQSPNYKDGEFKNLESTPNFTEGGNMAKVLFLFFFGKKKRAVPAVPLPSHKTNLHHLPPHENVLVWFGHSSYFIQADGKKILVDPVFSGSVSPLSFNAKSFKGTDVYQAEEMPDIDYLFLTHDHWDHLDYETIIKLKPKVRRVITALGVAAHLERWGYNLSVIEEKDWGDTIGLGQGFIATTATGRHFSGRGFKRNQTLWASFILKTPSFKIYLGGDSGYGSHFKSIGQEHGPFDLAVLECGQYNRYWKHIHMMPEETVKAAQDLGAKALLPVHWGKFSIALHEWDEPVKRVAAEAEKQGLPLLTPMIGEQASLDNPGRSFVKWWEGLGKTLPIFVVLQAAIVSLHQSLPSTQCHIYRGTYQNKTPTGYRL